VSERGRSARTRPVVNPGVDPRFNPSINPCSDDTRGDPDDHRGMTTSDYILNALFVSRMRESDGSPGRF
jgi:hypothetical protein